MLVFEIHESVLACVRAKGQIGVAICVLPLFKMYVRIGLAF